MVDFIDQHYNENHLDVLDCEHEGYCAIEFETLHGGSNDNVKDVPTVDCIKQHYNDNPVDVPDIEYIDFLDKSKFSCPYCWYKRNVNMNPELSKRIFTAKNALLSLANKDVVMNDRLVKTLKAPKGKEPNDVGGIPLGQDGRQGMDEVGVHPVQPKVDLPIKLQKDASVQCDIALEDQAYSNGDFRSCREEVLPVDINPVEGSLELKESFETGDSRPNKEDVHERIVDVGEEEEPGAALHLGKHIEGHSHDIEFVQGTQESVLKSGEKGRKSGKGKIPGKENKVSATGSSVSETNNSDSDAISERRRYSKRKIQKTKFPQDVHRKSLLQGDNIKEEEANDIDEEVTSYRLRRRSKSSQKQE
ncbi:hypothetical protein PIB30_076834 [Stylosanthes scabra]|uniref:Uncharacterized protein n=1 Tax=Stylosanthes scabra TaxID=79078 RepID=A0ABU6VSC9_9FABA|nr:hypothetical protein [Stylosanthes scabra]